MKEILFNPNPASIIPDHWVTKEFGFEVFSSANEVDRWVYIKINEDKILKATPEFLEDTQAARLAFSKAQY